MTDVSTHKAPRQPAPIPPWVLNPSTIFVANIVCLPINLWAVEAEADRRLQLANTCGTFIGMSWPVALLVFALFAVTASGIVLTIIWCRRKRASGGNWGPIIGAALLLAILAIINMYLVADNVGSAFDTFDCSGLG